LDENQVTPVALDDGPRLEEGHAHGYPQRLPLAAVRDERRVDDRVLDVGVAEPVLEEPEVGVGV
jgi:hypothetical protein